MVKPFPIEQIRKQFPALSAATAFLDNPAGTQVPRQVIQAVTEAMTDAASNIGGYLLAKAHLASLRCRLPTPDARTPT